MIGRALRGIDLRSRLGLLAVLIVGGGVRMQCASGRGPWLDEAFCVRFAQFDWGELVARSGGDNHPPLFFALLKLWMTLFGDSLLALPTLDVLLGVATIWTVFVLALRIFATRDVASAAARGDDRGGLGRAGSDARPVVGADPHVRSRRTARGDLGLLLLLRALERPMSWARWAAWTLGAICLVYTHYYGVFVVLAQGLHALVVAVRSPERRALVLRVIVSGLAICLAFLPWLGVALTQTGDVVKDWWVPPLTPRSAFWDWARIPGLLGQDDFAFPTGGRALALGALAIALGIIVVVAAVRRERGTRLVAWCTLFPLAAGLAISLAIGQNVILARYLIVAQVFAPLAVVGVVYARARRRVATLLMAPIAFAVITALAASYPLSHRNPIRLPRRRGSRSGASKTMWSSCFSSSTGSSGFSSPSPTRTCGSTRTPAPPPPRKCRTTRPTGPHGSSTCMVACSSSTARRRASRFRGASCRSRTRCSRRRIPPVAAIGSKSRSMTGTSQNAVCTRPMIELSVGRSPPFMPSRNQFRS